MTPKLRKANQKDKDSIALFLDKYFSSKMNLDKDSRYIYLMEMGKSIVGIAFLSSSIISTFYPVSRKQRKEDDLLDKLGFKDNEYMIIERIFLLEEENLSYMFSYLESIFHNIDWIIMENKRERITFYENRRFFDFGLIDGFEKYEKSHLLARRYIRMGLASWSF